MVNWIKKRMKERTSWDGAVCIGLGLMILFLTPIAIIAFFILISFAYIGRYLLEGDSTVWMDGPLTRAVKAGGICYLDEVVEARKDTTVIIHPLTDHRRILPVEKKGELLEADDGFLLVLSYSFKIL